jgi:hypothetical protein
MVGSHFSNFLIISKNNEMPNQARYILGWFILGLESNITTKVAYHDKKKN